MNSPNKLLVLMVITYLCSACSYFGVFNIPAIEGRVVDSDTKEPLEGVVLVAERRIKGGYHGSTAGYLQYQLAITGEDGVYAFEGLGLVGVDDYISIRAPILYVFKADYRFRAVHNRQAYVSNDGGFRRMSMHDARFEFNRISVWDGRDIEMEKFEGNDKEYIAMLHHAMSLFDINTYSASYTGGKKPGYECNWIGVDIPHWYEMINRELKVYHTDNRGIVESSYKNYKNCSKWEEFFKVYSR